jgi:sulfur-oxidizing protein SoxX
MTSTDPSTDPKANGGNCYNCHQIDKKELSYGTIGPSLWNYGKNRGISDVTADTAAPIVHYTWVKLWNSKAYAACSNMPRFGHMKLLDEQQLRHIMSLLLDPRSPVNQ